ncbi:hypothetical protein [Actinocorallia herbida]|uniref:hypothetical protein n=1 Tax=Actinocorallia herbida TaxID=58109 RepID=UPI000F4C1717|nr:hypothetical protein [Actinocorallia herbida]
MDLCGVAWRDNGLGPQRALVAGTFPPTDPALHDGVSYVRVLGLTTRGPTLQIANPIYREVILRVLGAQVESMG